MPQTSSTTYTARYPNAFINESFQIEQKISSDLLIAQARDYNILLAEILSLQQYVGIDPTWIRGTHNPLNRGGNPANRVNLGAPTDPNASVDPDTPLINFFPGQGTLGTDPGNLAFAIHSLTLDFLGKDFSGTLSDLASGDTAPLSLAVSNNRMLSSGGNAKIQSLLINGVEDNSQIEFVTFTKDPLVTDRITITNRAQNGSSAQGWNVTTPGVMVAVIKTVDASWNDVETAFAMQSLDGSWWRITISDSGHLQATDMGTNAPNPPTQ